MTRFSVKVVAKIYDTSPKSICYPRCDQGMKACAVWLLAVLFSSWALISEIPVQFVLMSICY